MNSRHGNSASSTGKRKSCAQQRLTRIKNEVLGIECIEDARPNRGAVCTGALASGSVDGIPPRPRIQRRMVTRRWFKWLLVLSLCASGCQHMAPTGHRHGDILGSLNALRDDINSQHGFRNDVPRINLGPCGRFARDFRERWNARFREPATIAFIMSNTDRSNCFHVRAIAGWSLLRRRQRRDDGNVSHGSLSRRPHRGDEGV